MNKHYTVGYHELNKEHKDICTYATDSFEAYKVATEDIKYLHEHPHSIDSIMLEQ